MEINAREEPSTSLCPQPLLPPSLVGVLAGGGRWRGPVPVELLQILLEQTLPLLRAVLEHQVALVVLEHGEDVPQVLLVLLDHLLRLVGDDLRLTEQGLEVAEHLIVLLVVPVAEGLLESLKYYGDLVNR